MNPVDLGLLILIGLLAVGGLRRGFIMGVLDLVGIAAGLVVASLYYQELISPLMQLGLNRESAAIVSFIVLNLIALVLASMITGFIFQPLSRFPWPFFLRWGDSLLGLIPGAIKGLALGAVIVLPLAFLQQPASVSEMVRQSRFAAPLIGWGLDAVYAAVERYGINLADFAVITSRPEDQSTQLPFRVTTGLRTDAAAEAEMLMLINQARTEAGLNPLAIDPALTGVSVAHSQEMLMSGFFGHQSPTTGNHGDRLNAAGVTYVVSGENLAYAPSVAIAHANLMASPTHYGNIMNPAFTRVGIGVVAAPNRGLMITQLFAK